MTTIIWPGHLLINLSNRIEGSQDYLSSIEKKTRVQSNSSIWIKERLLRITASNVGTIVGIVHMTDRKNKDLFVDSMINPRLFTSAPTE